MKKKTWLECAAWAGYEAFKLDARRVYDNAIAYNFSPEHVYAAWRTVSIENAVGV